MSQDKPKVIKMRRLSQADAGRAELAPQRAAMPYAELEREREALAYTQAEQHYSAFLQRQLLRLLKGDAEELMLLRHYCHGKQELGVFLPADVSKRDVRPEVAQALIYGVVQFLDPFAPGGPISQTVKKDRLVETQLFPTHYPHIVLERIDVFKEDTGCSLYIQWRAIRVQNQRKSTLVNRALDVGTLALEIAKFL